MCVRVHGGKTIYFIYINYLKKKILCTYESTIHTNNYLHNQQSVGQRQSKKKVYIHMCKKSLTVYWCAN